MEANDTLKELAMKGVFSHLLILSNVLQSVRTREERKESQADFDTKIGQVAKEFQSELQRRAFPLDVRTNEYME